MRENTVPEIIKIVDEATTPVLILIVADNCDKAKPRVQEDLERQIINNNRPVALFTVCMPEETLTFPRPITPEVYYYLPKNQTPVFWRGQDMIQNLIKDIEVAERMIATGESHEIARYTDEERARIVTTEANFSDELVHATTFPPKLQQARNFVREMWSTAKRGMTNLPLVATAEEGGRRLAICQACPSFEVDSNRCKECGCSMILKTQLAGSTCPLAKW